MAENPYGLHRVIKPLGALPQAAEQLSVHLPLFSNEILIELEKLNLDSSSFKQIVESEQGNLQKIKEHIQKIVQERGKMHNPITGSGGMLIGKVKEIGKNYAGALKLKVGDKIATLVSLTLTPLYLDEIQSIDLKTGQVGAKGYAILFESGIASLLPSDIPEKIALAVLDVCGAPALTLRYAKKEDKVLFIGAGKSAKLAAAALQEKFEKNITIHALDVSSENLTEMKEMNLADEIFRGDAAHVKTIQDLSLQNDYDLVVNVANVPNTEMISILCCREKGSVIFFSMATSFTRVALGAEGLGKDIQLLIGNGYAQGHAELALNLVRKNKKLREWFEKKYSTISTP